MSGPSQLAGIFDFYRFLPGIGRRADHARDQSSPAIRPPPRVRCGVGQGWFAPDSLGIFSEGGGGGWPGNVRQREVRADWRSSWGAIVAGVLFFRLSDLL